MNKHPKLYFILSMLIFSTIGIARRYIPLSSAALAMVRGVIGAAFLLLFVLIRREKIAWQTVRKNLLPLCLSGVFVAVNWILLFESYRFTTVATATLCYYMAPIFVTLLSPLFFKEKLTVKKLACVLVALGGMVLISGVLQAGGGGGDFRGILCGLGAAVFYACVTVLNKTVRGVSPFDKTIIQLSAAFIVLIPYVLLTESAQSLTFTPAVMLLILIVGVLHTGVAFACFFGSVEHLPAQTVALLSYLDPVLAIFLSAVFLRETVGLWSVIGAVLVLGSTLVNELTGPKEKSDAPLDASQE
ncbi:MAG TPA: DMT family transporter [Papillibacter sp.]|jgi:RarD protein|nr:DMT family transporter [Papillibacter sp.]